ncbi:MAG TPA: L,D-transpeptidase [Chloroflexota bacterium]|nr:L,D-transpeptidase [Chloroflexota bacterium]
MRVWRFVGFFTFGIVAIATPLLFVACFASRPSLTANIADGAQNVPLQTNLQITAVGAIIDRAVLQRVDDSSPPVTLQRTANGAEILAELEPDAQYRLSATAQPVSRTSLPWDSTPDAQISLEQQFSTVETPTLQEADDVLPISRDKPTLIHFSQPLAQATVTGGGPSASISKSDARVIEVSLPHPAPGTRVSLRLTNVVGTDGVAAPEATVALRAPDAVALAAVAGMAPSAHMGLPPGTQLSLQFDRPITSLRYRIDDKQNEWRGPASDVVELPLKVEGDTRAAVTVVDATAADGGWLAEQQAIEIAAAQPIKVVAMWPEDGEEDVNPTTPPVFRFSEEVADRSAAEAAISFDPPVPGRFDWLAGNRVRFIPSEPFPADSEVTVQVDGNPRKIRGVSGGYLEDAVRATYSTGKLKVIDVALGKQQMTLLEDGEAVMTLPVATGVAAAPTPTGTFHVLYKVPIARFRGVNPDGSRYDIPDVHWVMAFQGDYTIHGAYWRPVFGRPGSDGCVSLSDANAKKVYDWADDNTPVVIHT